MSSVSMAHTPELSESEPNESLRDGLQSGSISEGETIMNFEKKSLVVGLFALGLLVRWTIDFVPTVSAEQDHQHTHAPASSKQLKNPLPATEENIASGRALFNQHCASCHGEDGRAQTQMATSMKVKPANLTGSAVHGRMPGEIYSVITNGIKTSGMPAFKDKMSEQERWQTVLYVQRLQGEHQHTAENQPAGTAAKPDDVQHPHQ